MQLILESITFLPKDVCVANASIYSLLPHAGDNGRRPDHGKNTHDNPHPVLRPPLSHIGRGEHELRIFNFQWYILILTLLFSTYCNAEVTPDSEQPVKIESSHVEFDDQKGTAIYTGNVIADQGSRHLKADKLTIYRSDNNKIKLMIATGKPAYFQSNPDKTKPMGNGNANTIKYFPIEDKVDLIGNAKLEQNGDMIYGHYLTYYFANGILKSNPVNDQRTTVILQPKQKNP